MLNPAQLARVDLNLLILFDLLFKERSASRVAAEHHLSPSAISHALRRLRSTLNDPLFLPSAKGLVPTERANVLAPAVRDVIERVVGILGSADAFDSATAERHFKIGAPDGAISVIVPGLMRYLEEHAPRVGISVIQLLPSAAGQSADQAWRESLLTLDAGLIDLAILPHRPLRDRYAAKPLYTEDFVFIARTGHPLEPSPSAQVLTEYSHVLVSATGDTSGIVDARLSELSLKRRIALTVPSFLMAASAVASSNLIGAVPRRFAVNAAQSYDLDIFEPPFPLASADLHAIAVRAAMLDKGVAWLTEVVSAVCSE